MSEAFMQRLYTLDKTETLKSHPFRFPGTKNSNFRRKFLAAMAVTTVEEPMLSRLDRLDIIVRRLEELRGGNRTPKSSCPSTPSSGTLTSEGQVSSMDFSPRSLEKHCRPIDDVIMETGMKGTLIERLVHVEDRVAKLCMQLEEEMDAEKRRVEEEDEKKKLSKKKRGLKQLVKSCVTGNGRSVES
ncbi:hypothetical protein L1987_12289 [Smallanthus sonchifolius]|uniref:Uncharacterized protein n=1 Tax=Smallanthus sonchifolius TaxID=185202 RepID=A0ACB9JE80_9ASTR|nr:hypothetical protein L1987_12289 [Smallanthus sonchifolius]